jgi:hypothetical protein
MCCITTRAQAVRGGGNMDPSTTDEEPFASQCPCFQPWKFHLQGPNVDMNHVCVADKEGTAGSAFSLSFFFFFPIWLRCQAGAMCSHIRHITVRAPRSFACTYSVRAVFLSCIRFFPRSFVTWTATLRTILQGVCIGTRRTYG